MKAIPVILLTASFILAFATFSFAAAIDQRIIRAEEHIDRGIQSGAISQDEAHRLKGELRAVREDEARLNRELERLEKNIYRASTNDNIGYGGHGKSQDHGKINVVSGSYGSNCGAEQGNVTQHLATQCNGQRVCKYKVDYTVLGDTVVGCAKNYVAQWRCGNGPIKSVSAPPEAGFGAVIILSCQ